MLRSRHLWPLAALAVVLAYAAPAPAQSVIDEWNSVKAPPVPELKSVTVDPKSTALLMLDIVKQLCSPNPRCIASLPKIQKLLSAARTNGATVIYSLPIIPPPGVVIGDTLPEVAPKGDEPVVHTFFDKFSNTDLDKILKDKGIKTVIVTGVNANGAVLYTASEAAFLGFKVIDPIDGSSAENEYIEQYVVYNFAHAPLVSSAVTLTTSDMIKF